LVVTGNFLRLDCESLFRLGAADVLHKPVHIYELRAAVIDILSAAAAARRPGWREAAARVLHVEDTDDWVALLRLWLAESGYASHRVGCRAELLRFLRSCRELPDCIVLDLSLPDGDGLALCDELKGQPDFQAIPVVVFTARGEDRLAALRHRAVQVVLKPQGSGRPARDEVMAVIDSVVDQSERTRGVIRKAGLKLDPRGNGVFLGLRRVAELDSAKFSILRLLLERSPEPVAEEELRGCLPRFGYRRHHPEDPDPKTVAVYISGIRGRLASAPLVQISNVPGQGYALRALDGHSA
jgi:DNA-binding response OmpR family regulator